MEVKRAPFHPKGEPGRKVLNPRICRRLVGAGRALERTSTSNSYLHTSFSVIFANFYRTEAKQARKNQPAIRQAYKSFILRRIPYAAGTTRGLSDGFARVKY